MVRWLNQVTFRLGLNKKLKKESKLLWQEHHLRHYLQQVAISFT